LDVYRKYSEYENLVPLLLRIGVGLTFLFAGVSKVLGGVGGFSGFLASLGVPLAGVMGPFVAYLELLGGLAILLGLATRLVAALLIANMFVAMALVTIPGWMGAERGLAAGFAQTRVEVMLALACAALIITGAGLFSLDARIFGPREAVRREEIRVSPAR
jgi:putative oxidoreductase